ncbi:MAG: RIP metalloprotease RseP [Melioribacteraceae bacterium]|jgi:regulator of sigma E protease|nr:RIP metalloprotease RseP [Melioribacteraceae bacterium]
MDYVIYFILTIGILVFIHELGHFLAARACKMRTDVFSIGFGKRLFGWNQINGFTTGNLPEDLDLQGHTDYRVALLPLGGYVKISGMVDESFDNSFANTEPKPYEFRAKPTYQKLFVISAGVLMNLILTIAIFSGINYFQGKQLVKTTTVGVVEESTLAYEAGFRTDDKVISINEEEISDWFKILTSLFLDESGVEKKVTVFRNTSNISFIISEDILAEAAQSQSFLPYGNIKPAISSVVDESPANDAGIKGGDIFLSLNNLILRNSADAIKIISSSSNVELSLTILRGEDTIRTAVTPGLDGKIGIVLGDKYTGKIEYEEYTFFAAIGSGLTGAVQYVTVTFEYMGRVIFGDLEVAQAFGGPVKIAQIATEAADAGMIPYLRFLAVLSLSLAILNILPFPVLDGGHFVMIAIEGIFRREIPIKVKIAIQNAGFVLILMLMAFIIYNDIINM